MEVGKSLAQPATENSAALRIGSGSTLRGVVQEVVGEQFLE